MGDTQEQPINISSFDDEQLQSFLQKNAMSLSLEEARSISSLLKRDPTLTELHIFNIQWSEHSSYKSSRPVLKQLPTDAPNVILGPVEDSGIIQLGEHEGEQYGVVISHESHNHPSQVVPYEGAATGVGGIIRDVNCMGSKVFAIADLLRFGDLCDKSNVKAQYIANEVINGIAGYANAVGVPTIAGDIYTNASFNDNCLVNVVCLGIIKEKDIVHSYAPKNAEGYDIIVVGKATDNSGFGGAAFASVVLDEEEQESNRGAVQVPDPFLKNILLRATQRVFEQAREQNITLGFKDMGAGGIMCATTELCSDGGYGAEINLDNIHTAFDGLPSYVIAASETQERFCWISPKDFTQTILKTYNEEFELPRIAHNARASLVGTVTKSKEYVLRHKDTVVCSADIDVITKGVVYQRETKENHRDLKEPELAEPKDYAKALLEVLNHPNVACKHKAYKHYDTNVQGNTIIHAGEADAGLMAPVPGSPLGVALKADGNPRYNRISPYWGSVAAVAESMRNVASIGATPSALTDCLNYGNPEDPLQFWDFCEGVRGIADAAKSIKHKDTGACVPIVSGNVSFYNTSAKGQSVDPSPIVACVGIMKDYTKAITSKLVHTNSQLILIGNRKDELGGSVYYDTQKELGANVPQVDFDQEKKQIHAVIDAIDHQLVSSCHDISDGGLGACVSEMIVGSDATSVAGAQIDLSFSDLTVSKTLFSETSGFVLEVQPEQENALLELLAKHGVPAIPLGSTTTDLDLTITQNKGPIAVIRNAQLSDAWLHGFTRVMS